MDYATRRELLEGATERHPYSPADGQPFPETKPKAPGEYRVKLFTGISRIAYWTGKEWVDSDSSKQENRKRSDRLNRMIKHWRAVS